MLPLLLTSQLLSANIHWTGPKLSPADAAAVLAKSPGASNLTGKTLTQGDGPTTLILEGGSPLGDPRELTWDWRPLNCCSSFFGDFPFYFPGYFPGAFSGRLVPTGYLNPSTFFGTQGFQGRRSTSTAPVTTSSPGRSAPPTNSVHRSSAMPGLTTTGSKRP
jgi:hypothetical protein